MTASAISRLTRVPALASRPGMQPQGLERFWVGDSLMLDDNPGGLTVADGGVQECWIDQPRHPLVESALGPDPDTQHLAQTAVESPAIDCDRVPEPSVSLEDELPHAARLCKKAKQAVGNLFCDLRMGKTLHAESFLPLVDELSASVFRNPGALVNLTRLKTKDDYTVMHSVAVCALMISVARETGMRLNACRQAGLAGLLHDVGKAVMPLDILDKPGELTDEEFDVMRSHLARGHQLLLAGGAVELTALDVRLHHHERMDGLGYPDGLVGTQISTMARMCAICDVYDAVTSARPLQTAWDPADALSKMASWKGRLDPGLFAAFVRSLGIYPSGSLVRLLSGRLAVVVKQHATDISRPSVKVFFSTKTNLKIPVIELDLANGDADDAIACREPPRKWNFGDLDALSTGAVRQL